MRTNNTESPEEKRRRKELANKRFEREEMGELLRLFSALGVTVALGILGFFLAGLWVDRQLTEMGWQTRSLPRIAGIVLGLAFTMYWAYLRIVRHLRKYDPSPNRPEDEKEEMDDGDRPPSS